MNTSRVDRVNASRALAKAIAYRDCGKNAEAERWAITLLRELQTLDIIRPDRLASYSADDGEG